MNPKEFLTINGIDVGFGSHSIASTVYNHPSAFVPEVNIRKGKLRINLLTPTLELTNLEELIIQGANLTEIPQEIGLLSALSAIRFRSNQLVSLPDNIGHLPHLRELNIEYNSLQKLPESLANLPSVNVERKYMKLYMDMAYKSKNLKPIDDSLFDLTHYQQAREQLANEIDDNEEVKAYKDFLLDTARMGTYLMRDDDLQEILPGTSKVGGSPDLPEDWAHPANKNGALYLFHAQNNCEEAAPCQDFLPRTSMLYFFASDEEHVDKTLVVYAKAHGQLKRHAYNEHTEFTDPDFDDNYWKAVAVKFVNAVSLPSTYNLYNHGGEQFPKYAEYLEKLENDDAERTGSGAVRRRAIKYPHMKPASEITGIDDLQEKWEVEDAPFVGKYEVRFTGKKE